METKNDLEKDLANKGPSFIFNYLFYYYKEVGLFQKTGLLEDLLNKMSLEGKVNFEGDLKGLERFVKSKKTLFDEDYKNWCKEHSKNRFSNKKTI